ncbi:hypothetical protein NDU88_004710 [Pleurodeles waltl]|uniref:Uncharacterized protein n=1 Tax=Pleurodeles waltl TaxID=8319 RepID=A0AAV7SJP4_PLEWA|nr:hypothetical protein NDU88_004710 [Pleurodeles waltl]
MGHRSETQTYQDPGGTKEYLVSVLVIEDVVAKWFKRRGGNNNDGKDTEEDGDCEDRAWCEEELGQVKKRRGPEEHQRKHRNQKKMVAE